MIIWDIFMLSCHLCYAFIISQHSFNHDIKLPISLPLLLTMTFLISWFILYNEIAFYSTRIFRFRYLALSPLSPNGSAASAPTDAVQTVQRALTWQYSMHHFCYELKCTNFAKMQWDCNRDLRSFVQHCSGWVSGPSARCTVWCWCRSSASCASSTPPGLPSVCCSSPTLHPRTPASLAQVMHLDLSCSEFPRVSPRSQKWHKLLHLWWIQFSIPKADKRVTAKAL